MKSIEDLKVDETLAVKFIEQVVIGAEELKKYGVDRYYIGIETPQGLVGIPVDEVYNDGFYSDGVFYSFVPFRAVTDKLAKGIKKKLDEIRTKVN